MPGIGAADAGGGDVHPVGLAVLHNLGIAARDAHACIAGSLGHGAHLRFEHRRGQAGLENKADDQRFGASAGDRQIVDRAVDREFADGSTGKTERTCTTKLSVVIPMRVPLKSR